MFVIIELCWLERVQFSANTTEKFILITSDAVGDTQYPDIYLQRQVHDYSSYTIPEFSSSYAHMRAYAFAGHSLLRESK